MSGTDAASGYDAFWDDLLRDTEVSGDPQRAAFFRVYSELAAENGDCADLVYCPVIREGARPYQVDGYAFDRDSGELHVAVCDFRPERKLQSLNANDIIAIFRRVHRFCKYAVRSEFVKGLEETSPEFELAWLIQNNADFIRRVRCIMFSNARLATRKKTLETGQVIGAEMTFNIIDFKRFVDIQNAMGGTEPIELDLSELNGDILPCLEAHFDDSDYESYLVVMPGSLLARIYGLYGARLMEQNVRTFLQARTKANKGIIRTANEEPEMFFAYNNGITATASGVKIETGENGMTGISRISNLQIVNGGQTTASLLYARDRGQSDLSKVFVQMKLSVVHPERIEDVVPLISRYANTQNRVSEADFFSSHPFHVEMQQISRRLAAPAATGALSATRWFYERARGQYKNEGMLRSPADRKKFEAEFPKSQVIQKTDLAKYQLTFSARPHIVSLGAQKCFLQYAQEISRKWEQTTGYFNDEYFRQTVAKAIVFRWLDRHVGTTDWYTSDRGYKANIVTYTLAWLVRHLDNERSAVLDLDQIWKLQSVPTELQDCLASLAPEIATCIKSPPSGVSNISEYAKTQACWSQVSALRPELPDILDSFTISLEEQKEQARDAKSVKALDNEIEFESLLAKNMGRLPGVRRVAEQNRLLSPLSIKGLQKAQNGNLSLSRKERSALKHLFDRLDERGLGPASWND
ncbi:AIPR family protein [Hoeflea sp.]|uniref:AIPR family protein n=1 Tax=Hoeflea sp. TaxID=1940281 RepID=UPI003B022903